MNNRPTSYEEIIADERFLSWYFKTDVKKSMAWETIVANDAAMKPLVEEALAMMALLKPEKEVPETQVFAAEQRLLKQLANEPQPKVIRMRPLQRWLIAAAVVAALLVGSTWWWQANQTTSLTTSCAELLEKTLPDGSQVILNANSKISFSSGWEQGKKREVWLNGEAFFHVRKTTSHSRFIVHTDQFDVVVTGTQFNVKNKEGQHSILLTEGSVMLLTKDGQELHMVPGDFVSFNNNHLQKDSAREESVLAWKERKLFFTNTPLLVAVKTIEEHYGVKITLKDPEMGKRLLTGILPNDNLDVLLVSLETAMKLKVSRQGTDITIAAP